MNIKFTILLALCVFSFIDARSTYNHQRTLREAKQHYQSSNIIGNKQRKKDMFLSRGWGAGGMPFTVLYLRPTRSSYEQPPLKNSPERPMAFSKARSQEVLEQTDQNIPENIENVPYNAASLQQGQIHQPQARTAVKMPNPGNSGNRPHAVIPQLFLSYNWGPLGKK